MRAENLSCLGDDELLARLSTLVALERSTTAAVVAHLAEVDARKLHVPAGYPSMYEYCVRRLGFSEDAAYKRIQAARAARRFPAILTALADGRLHLTGIGLLVPHLTGRNAADLLAAAAGRTKAEIETMLAARFPRTEILPMLHGCQLAPAQVGTPIALPDNGGTRELSSRTVTTPVTVPSTACASQLAPAQVGAAGERSTEPTTPVTVPSMACASQLAPAQVGPRAAATLRALASDRYELHLSIPASMREKLEYARELMAHRAPAAGMAEVLEQGLDALIARLEKQKFAATTKPRSPRAAAARRESTVHELGTEAASRTIPAHVKREVWARDRGRCTFVSDGGHRCASRRLLEYDHVEPVARGGPATVGNLRLRCRAHNQHEAERVFGEGFMRAKRGAGVRASFPP